MNPEFREFGAKLLREGYPATQALSVLLAGDCHANFRQVALMDKEGRFAVHTGSNTRPWSGHRQGDGCVALGNVLAEERVVAGMVRAFELASDEALPARLLAALEGGKAAGGQTGRAGPLGERSAALLVKGRGCFDGSDLRVDLHDDAIGELRRVFEEYRPHTEYHRQRWLAPASSVPQEQFVSDLAEGRAGSVRRDDEATAVSN